MFDSNRWKNHLQEDESQSSLVFLSVKKYFYKIGNSNHISKCISKKLSHVGI